MPEFCFFQLKQSTNRIRSVLVRPQLKVVLFREHKITFFLLDTSLSAEFRLRRIRISEISLSVSRNYV